MMKPGAHFADKGIGSGNGIGVLPEILHSDLQVIKLFNHMFRADIIVLQY